ncbi:hypothetical protein QN277_011642 [Acacia crassicarpa]|uniref:AAA+ ATPase domain-containing protein n=1 Tax=Acacia crassicarpa TaxID=499986 RepID=A0AAE1TCJ7_9FABA|nr:hypothetical protein QN277_011642 [Acacia crassicarpa]
MASFSVTCSAGLSVAADNFGVSMAQTRYFGFHGVFCTLSFRFPSVRLNQCFKSQYGSFCNRKMGYSDRTCGTNLLSFPYRSNSRSQLNRHGIEPLMKGSRGDRRIHFGKGEGNYFRNRFSLRLRPRLRLLASRMKRFPIKSFLNEVGIFIRKNIRAVAFSTSVSIVLGLCYMFLKLTTLPSPTIVPYSDLITNLQSGSVTKVLIEEGSRRIYYNVNSQNVMVKDKEITDQDSQEMNVSVDRNMKKLASDDTSKSGPTRLVNVLGRFPRAQTSVPEWQYSTRKIDHDGKYLVSLMREKGVTYSSAPQSMLMSMRSILITVLTLWIPLTPMMWLLYRQLSAANSPAKKQKPHTQNVGFDDVEGVDAAKVELMEIVSCLQGDIQYQKLGAKLPRGVLLVGPPGTGKTLLARAVAGEAGVPFFTVSASEFVEMFVGRGAARIRDLFKAARKFAPSIIFIDELDAVGGRRGRSFNDERDQTLNQLLTEMDGFESEMRVVVIAATNRPEALDSALCRPGRFSRKVYVGEPDEEGRRRILAVHLRGVPLEEETSIICHLVASLTPGFVGADLANIVNEAALLAARRGGETVTREDIMEAIERAKFGINGKKLSPNTISKELEKIFPWMPSLMGRSDRTPNDPQGPLGYQALSS